MSSRGSEERDLSAAANISKNMQGVNVLMEDKGGDGAVMTSFLNQKLTGSSSMCHHQQ